MVNADYELLHRLFLFCQPIKMGLHMQTLSTISIVGVSVCVCFLLCEATADLPAVALFAVFSE